MSNQFNSSGPPRDHSRIAARYLFVLAFLQLLCLNFAGALFFWFAKRVRERQERFRKASLWLLGLHFAAEVLLIVWATWWGTDRLTVGAFGNEWHAPPLWVVYAVGLPVLVAFGLPFWWLRQDSYQNSPSVVPDQGSSRALP